MLEPHAVVGAVATPLSCTHHHANSCTRVLVQLVYTLIPFRLFFSFVLKIIAPLLYQKESTVSSGISDRSSTPQPVSAVTLFAAGDCGSVSDCSWSEQHPVSAENLSDGCYTITDSSSPSKPRRGQKRDTANSLVLQHAVPVGARPKRRAVDCNTTVNNGCPCNTNNKNNSWFSSSSLTRKKPSATLSFSSRRIRIPGIVNGLAVSGLTVDSASDITCVSLLFLKQHPTMCKARVETVPPSSMSATNGSSLEILRFIELSLTLGDITRRIDVLVIPSLGPDQVFYKKYFKDVSREFDEFQVNTHLCKLRCRYL